jgi:outer membrane protein OmpA-like peptidoglycan-associated protein/opacity protein-like surface antigen
MKLCARITATIAVALSLTPASLLYAADQAVPLDSTGQPGTTVSSAAQSQGKTSTTHTKRNRHSVPKAELFVGYSHFRAVPTLTNDNRMVGLNGGNASIAFNFNRYIGLVGDFGGYDDTALRLTGPGAVPTHVVDSSGTAYTYLFGPRLSLRKNDRITPFAEALFGGVHASAVTISGCTGAACTPLPSQNSFAMTAGVGLDLRVTHHVSIRAIQAEYMMTRFAPLSTGASSMQNDIRLSSGLLFRFGGSARPEPVANQPPVVTCSTESKRIYAGSGETVNVHAHATDPDNDLLSYSWTSDSGRVDGSGSEVSWNSSGTAPGSYKVSLHVEDGRGGAADCSTDVLVEAQANHPPTLSCSVDRASVAVGEPVLITATASDADNDPLTFSWNASGGQIIGTGATVKFDTSGLVTNRYTVTGQANDGRGGTADCSVSVDVDAPTPLEIKLALHSIYFPTAEPTAQDPSGGLLTSQKQTLMELASDFEKYLESKPDAHLILEGHADPRGSVESNQTLSERRVERTKQYLIERGVPAANIETKAFGVQRNLTDAQVTDAVEHSPELTSDERQKILDNRETIILASNRRVDVTLSTTGQRSARQYPFNAADALTLLRQKGPKKGPASGSTRKVQRTAK